MVSQSSKGILAEINWASLSSVAKAGHAWVRLATDRCFVSRLGSRDLLKRAIRSPSRHCRMGLGAVDMQQHVKASWTCSTHIFLWMLSIIIVLIHFTHPGTVFWKWIHISPSFAISSHLYSFLRTRCVYLKVRQELWFCCLWQCEMFLKNMHLS